MLQRWKLTDEELILAFRFGAIAVGAILFAVLPWPASHLLQIGMLAAWIGTGAISFAVTHGRTASVELVRKVWRLLILIDFAVALVAVVNYAPIFPTVWAGLLVFPIYAASRDRITGALVYGGLAMIAIAVLDGFGLLGEGGLGPLLMRLGITAALTLVTCGTSVIMDISSGKLIEQQTALRDAERAQAQLARIASSRAITMTRVIELGVALLRERDVATLLDRILGATLQTFGFEAGTVWVNEREKNRFVAAAVQGYDTATTERRLLRTLSFAEMQVRLGRRFEVRPNVFYAPFEHQSWRLDRTLFKRPELASANRPSPGDWHEADALAFALRSSSGETIGVLTVDAPTDRRVPDETTMETLSLFSNLTAAAIENIMSAEPAGAAASLGRVRLEAEQRRLKANRAARILEVAASLREVRDLDALLRRILDLTLDMFNFNAGTIALYDSRRRVFERHAVLGYPAELEGETIPQSTIDRMLNARTRVTDSFYWVPMELRVSGGVQRNPERARLPRLEKGMWHEDDLMLFPFFDSEHRIIGILSPDDPKDGRVPDRETVHAIEGFAQLAGAAVEIAHLRELSNRTRSRRTS